ncbi:hypothetical protein JCM8097_005361 [Rhodosporidiobolus ruineniae]
MSSLHHNPALQHPGGAASTSNSQQPSFNPTSPPPPPSSSGYDSDTLAPTTTSMSSAAPLNGGCVADDDDRDQNAREQREELQGDVGHNQHQHQQHGEDSRRNSGHLQPPQSEERPGLPHRSSSERLRSVARALEAANILSLSPTEDWDTRPPGIDARRVDIPDLKCQCVVQVADWSMDRVEFSVLTNKEGGGEVAEFLDRGRPEFAKVRWMHVNGLSWDVIKPLALHYDLHPLSLEDMLHHGSSSSTRSKVDYFRQHLFVSLIVHRTLDQPALDLGMPEEVALGMARSTTKALKGRPTGDRHRSGHLREQFGFHTHRRDEEAIVESSTSLPLPPTASSSSANGSYLATPVPSLPGTATPVLPGPGSALNPKSYAQYLRNLREAFKGVRRPKEETIRTLSHNRSGLSTRLRRGVGAGTSRTKTDQGAAKRQRHMQKEEEERAAARWTVAALTKDVKIHIHVEQLGIFLMRDGTILSFTQDAGYHRQISNLFERLQAKDDLMRDSEDASFVLQALLDVTADDALDIVDEFRHNLTTLESRVLSRADMEDVRHLHILSSQLLLLKSTLTPLQLLLNSLRAQDDAKAAAAFRLTGDSTTRPNSPAIGTGAGGKGEGGVATPQRKGFVSPEAKIYLGDVCDHVDAVLSSLDLFGDLSENLIAFLFNQMSYSSNAYMQALSVISLVFLPATFLSSYFGMNFTTGHFLDELDAGVSRFWTIVIPVSIATIVIFGWDYLAQVIRAMRRNLLRMWHRVQITRQRIKDD